MASITSVISIFVLLLATYCYSLPVSSPIDGSKPGLEVTTGQTMGDHENNAHLHLATEEELKKMPNIHRPQASAERDSGETATTEQPATADKDTSSPMTSTTKIPSSEKTNGKRAYYITYHPSLVKYSDGILGTGHVLADGTILTHGSIYANTPVVSYLTSYKRELKEEGEPSKDKRDYILERNLLTPMIDSFGHVFDVEEPLSKHYVMTTRELKEDGVPPKEGESTTDKQKAKRDYILERNAVTSMVDSFGRVFDIETPLSSHVVFTSREVKDGTQSTPETPLKEGESSTDKQKDKRGLFYEDSSLVRLVDGTIGRGSILSHGSVLSNGIMLPHGPIYENRNILVNDPLYIDGAMRTFVSTRGIKDKTNDKDASKEENSPTKGDNLATTMETSTDFEPRAIKPMDGQSGEETSTPFGKMPGNKNAKDGSSEESRPRLPEKQKPDVIVPGSKQPINKT